MFYCYLIKCQNITYIGYTSNLERRLKQHNGILKGGAKATKKFNNWVYKIIISFNLKSKACSFEALWKKNKNKRISGFNNRLNRCIELSKIFNKEIVDIKYL